MTDTVAASKPQVDSTAPGLSPGDLLKHAVSGSAKGAVEKAAAEKAPAEPTPAKVVPALKLRLTGFIDARAVVGAAGLTLGLAIGAGGVALMVPRGDSGAALMAKIEADLDTSRSETFRLSSELRRLAGTIASSGERAVDEAKAIRAELTQRIAKAEQALTTKMAFFADRHDAADKEQATRLTALGASIEKRLTAPAPPPAPAPQAAKPVAPEPTRTGSINDTKTAPDVKATPTLVANWALREVYDGIAVLEDRKHRLIEVARGDTIPGIGRAEAIERRGHNWVVVTRDGVITPQEW